MSQTLAELLNCLNTHDPGAMAAMMAEDVLLVDPDHRSLLGRELLAQSWGAFFSRHSEYWARATETTEEDEYLVVEGECGLSRGERGTVFRWDCVVEDGRLLYWRVDADAGESGKVVDVSRESWEPEARAESVADGYGDIEWAAHPEQGYMLTFDGPLEDRPHAFGGMNRVAGAVCPCCKSPLTQVALFERGRLPFSLGDGAPNQIPILFCWRCSLQFEEFRYRLRVDGGVEVLNPDPSVSEEGEPLQLPYDGYEGHFPELRVGLSAVETRTEWTDDSDPQHQVGGYPLIYNAQPEFLCGGCGKAVPFFATFCDNAAGQGYQPEQSKTFVQNCGLQLVCHWCADCAAISCYVSTD